MPNMEAGTVAEILVHHFVSHFGVPDILHTNQGRNFESSLLKEVCQLLGIVKTRTTPYHPQSDGLVERFNRVHCLTSSVLQRLRMNMSGTFISRLSCWPTVLVCKSQLGAHPFIFDVRSGSTPRLPADVMYSLPPSTTPAQVNQYALDLRLRLEGAYHQVRERMGLRHQRQKALYDRATHGKPYAVDDMVWLHCPCMQPVADTGGGANPAYAPPN